MAINDIVQTIAEARVDARSLSEFVFKPSGFKVPRRLAPPIDTLQFYIDRFDAHVATIPSIVNDAINNTAIEGSILADTFVTATANGVGSVARTQRDKNSDTVSIKDFGAKGDGVTDDSASVKPSMLQHTPEGEYVIGEDVPTLGLYGSATIKKPSGNFNASTVAQVNPTKYFKANAPFSSQNQIGTAVVDGYLYVVSSGRRDGSTQGTFDIYDLNYRNKIIKVSSLNIGVVSDQPRSLIVKSGYAYIRDFFGSKLFIVDVSIKSNPSLVKQVNLPTTSNASRGFLLGDILIYPLQSGSLELYSISDPLDPKFMSSLTLSGSVFGLGIDGSTLWIPVHNGGESTNLYKVSISDPLKPTILDSFTVPTMLYTRECEVRGGYLYAGGYDSTSRLCVYNINSGTPVLVYQDAELRGSRFALLGNALVSDDTVLDITDPENISKYMTLGVNFTNNILAYGSKVIGWGDIADGEKEGAPNDNWVDLYPVGVDLTGFYMPSAEFGNLLAHNVDVNTIQSKGNVVALGASIGAGGVSSTGVVAGRFLHSASGISQNGALNSVGHAVLTGILTDSKPLFRVYAGRSVFFRIRYTTASNIGSFAASYTMGEKVCAGIFTGGDFSLTMPIVDYGEPAFKTTKHTPVFTVLKNEGDEFLTVSFSCAELDATGSGAHIRLEVESFGALGFETCRIERIQ